MGARHLSRRALYLEGVPSGVSFPKFMKPGQIEQVKERHSANPARGWHDLIDEVILEAVVLDPDVQELLAVMQ